MNHLWFASKIIFQIYFLSKKQHVNCMLIFAKLKIFSWGFVCHGCNLTSLQLLGLVCFRCSSITSLVLSKLLFPICLSIVLIVVLPQPSPEPTDTPVPHSLIKHTVYTHIMGQSQYPHLQSLQLVKNTSVWRLTWANWGRLD